MSLETGRVARCAGVCMGELPSSFDLPHFEFRGEQSPRALYVCAHCGRLSALHDDALGHAFEPVGPSAVDSWYDGCWT